MEFLRLGSSIPGSYWGCCAVCVIQNFKVNPSTPHAIEIVNGDEGYPISREGEPLFFGNTYEEVFRNRIRVGTFSEKDMPNHVFLAVLTGNQLSSSPGACWLRILKEEGFEFIRSTDNSVYTGTHPSSSSKHPHKNYIFGLFRNIGRSKIDDPFKPPKEWTDLPDPYGGDYSPENLSKVQESYFNKRETTLYKRSGLPKEVPVWLAGRRSPNLQEMEDYRLSREGRDTPAKKAAPWKAKAA